MKPFTSLLLLTTLYLPLTAMAEHEGPPPPPNGLETRAWLRLQSSGTLAAPSPRQPGDAASRTYQRYLKSFEHPIPERFFDDQKGPVKE